MPGMQPEDVYELTGVSDPRLSPDGSTVAYVVWGIDKEKNEYRGAIWLAASDGSSPPQRLTSGEKRDADPRWSPDGQQIAFTSNRHGERQQLYVIPAGGPGEPRRLTDLKEDVRQAMWSPDGERIAFASRVRDPAYEEEEDSKREPRRIRRLWFKFDNEGWTIDRPIHLFVVVADGSAEPSQLTSGDFEDSVPAWSPDGSRIAFASARHERWDTIPARDIYVVAADGGEPELITATDGACELPSWSPDGSRIAYGYMPGIFDEPRHGQIAVVDLATRERRELTTALDRNCIPYPPVREPIWEGDDRLLFAVEDHGNQHIYRVATDGSESPELVVGGELAVLGYDTVAGRLVHTVSTLTTLGELFAGDRRLTDVGDAFTGAREIPSAERFTAVSTDGTEVEAWVVRPAGFREGERYPTLLNIHGGPFAQYENKLFDEFQVYAGAGYAVVYSNPRGSSGYDEAWGRAIRGPVEGGPGWGSVDYDDVMAVTDEALKRFDFVDPERLGVMGGSYGGYLTSWIVGHTDRFRCGISERAVNDMAYEDVADIAGVLKGYVGAHPWEAPDAYRQISPATYARNITTPLLILHSEDDLRCPIGQAELLFTILRVLGREVEFVRFPAESHELSRSGSPRHRVQRFEVILDWLNRHLQD
ncbi:MAG: S9 family peptidase [Actinomycetota bacterium]|nr:S9 family peptidase [Actinomycetota bacterium]